MYVNHDFYKKVNVLTTSCLLQNLKKLINFLYIVIFIESFVYKRMDGNFFIVNDLGYLKKHQKYISRLLKLRPEIFRECSFNNLKAFERWNFKQVKLL